MFCPISTKEVAFSGQALLLEMTCLPAACTMAAAGRGTYTPLLKQPGLCFSRMGEHQEATTRKWSG